MLVYQVEPALQLHCQSSFRQGQCHCTLLATPSDNYITAGGGRDVKDCIVVALVLSCTSILYTADQVL